MSWNFSLIQARIYQQLLQAPDSNDPSRSKVIFTLAPNLWKGIYSNQVTIYDLSNILGAYSAVKYLSNNKKENFILRDLINAGWPLYCARFGYWAVDDVINLIDITVNDSHGKPTLLYLATSGHLKEPNEAMFKKIIEDSSALLLKIREKINLPYYVYKLGQSMGFLFLRNGSEQPEIRNTFPTPDELGIKFIKESKEQTNLVLRPKDAFELLQRLEESQPKNVICDFSLLNRIYISEANIVEDNLRVIESYIANKLIDIDRTVLNDFQTAYARMIGALLLLIYVLPEIHTLSIMMPTEKFKGSIGHQIREPFHRRFHLTDITTIHTFSSRQWSIYRFNKNIKNEYLSIRKYHESYLPSVILKEPQENYFGSQSNILAETIAKHKNRNLFIDFPEERKVKYQPHILWTDNAYHPRIEEIKEWASAFGPLCELGEICEIFQGTIELVNEKTGAIFYPKVPTSVKNTINAIVLNNKDIILTPMKAQKCVMGEQFSPDVNIKPMRVIVLRVTDEEYSPDLLIDYLNNERGKFILNNRVTIEDGNYFIPDLQLIPVPIVAKEEYLENHKIEDLLSTIKDKVEKIIRVKEQILEVDTKNDFSRRINEARHYFKMVEMCIDGLDNNRFLIQNFYPFPLAFGYRDLDRFTDAHGLYYQQLRFGENILNFLVSVCLALTNLKDLQDDETLMDIFYNVTPGGWRKIITRCTKLMRYNEDELSQNLVSLAIDKYDYGFGSLINKFIIIKNNYKHDKIANEKENYSKLVEEMKDLIEQIMVNLKFFMEFPIHQVETVSYDRNNQKNRIVTLKYCGDHPTHSKDVIWCRNPFPENDLLIQTTTETYVSLYPFMTVYECPTCKLKEVFFLKSVDERKGIASIYSFERAHAMESNEIFAYLKKKNATVFLVG